MTVLMRMGVVYPANTAAVGVGAVMEALSAGELDTADIPYYYRWALFDGGGQAVDPGNMDERHLGYAQAALDGETVHPGFFYSQYHQLGSLSSVFSALWLFCITKLAVVGRYLHLSDIFFLEILLLML